MVTAPVKASLPKLGTGSVVPPETAGKSPARMPWPVPLPEPLLVALNLCVRSMTETVSIVSLWETAKTTVSPGRAQSLAMFLVVALTTSDGV